ncbi:hypothetical protein, partial [Blastomonas sp. CCH5-E3]|uniref:hypothetical protein n=1 Tax=Blastomonas sp. CCH5-E3 TaxID=1768750 RepID=UPI000A62D53C
MGAIFRITVDPSTNMVRQYLAGFFEAADVERFVAARNAAHERLTCGPNEVSVRARGVIFGGDLGAAG